MVTQIIGLSASQEQFSPQKTATASRLGPEERKNLSLQVLAQTESVSRLAQNHGVSRKFLYQQAAKASEAIDEAFTAPTDDDDQVLFYLPVTKKWILQFVLSLILICHSSFRGVIEILNTLFDYHQISLGTIHNMVREAIEKSQQINNAQDLSPIRIGLPDEIFQTGQPIWSV